MVGFTYCACFSSAIRTLSHNKTELLYTNTLCHYHFRHLSLSIITDATHLSLHTLISVLSAPQPFLYPSPQWSSLHSHPLDSAALAAPDNKSPLILVSDILWPAFLYLLYACLLIQLLHRKFSPHDTVPITKNTALA